MPNLIDIIETDGLDLNMIGVDSDLFAIRINNIKYKYRPINMSPQELAVKFSKMSVFSKGKALAWLKKNSELADKSAI